MFLAAALISTASAGALLDLRIEVEDGPTIEWQVEDPEVGTNLLATKVMGVDGQPVTLTANLIGEDEGQAVVQVDVVMGDAPEDRLGRVFHGTASWPGTVEASSDGPAGLISIDVTQDGTLEPASKVRQTWHYVLPESSPGIFYGPMTRLFQEGTSGGGFGFNAQLTFGRSPCRSEAGEASIVVGTATATTKSGEQVEGPSVMAMFQPDKRSVRKGLGARGSCDLPQPNDTTLELTYAIDWI